MTSTSSGAVFFDELLGPVQPSNELFDDAVAVAATYPPHRLPTAAYVDQVRTDQGWERLCAQLATEEVEMSSPPE